jgi:hypothetical protein
MKSVLTIAAAGAAAASLSAPGFAQCYAIFADDREPAPLGDYDLIAESEAPGLMDPPQLPDGANAIMCDRDGIVPAENDYEVLLHGVPLLIRSQEGEEPVITALDIADNQFRVRLMQGDVSEGDREAITGRLEGFYASYAELRAMQEGGDGSDAG